MSRKNVVRWISSNIKKKYANRRDDKSGYILIDSILGLCIVSLMLSIFLPGLYSNYQNIQEKINQTQMWHEFYKIGQVYMKSGLWGQVWNITDSQLIECQDWGCRFDMNEDRLEVIIDS